MKNMFKPPSTFKDRRPVLEFKSEIRAIGTVASSWVPNVEKIAIVPNGTPGRVGEIVDLMRRGEACIERPAKTPWTPPSDYEFIAKYMPDEQSRINFISKCEQWFADNPPRQIIVPVEKPVIDIELILALYKKYPGAVPPFEERMKVCRAAGYSEEYIAKKTERHRQLVEKADERQKAIDAVFGKWPTANKAVPKPKPKVILAVKKRT